MHDQHELVEGAIGAGRHVLDRPDSGVERQRGMQADAEQHGERAQRVEVMPAAVRADVDVGHAQPFRPSAAIPPQGHPPEHTDAGEEHAEASEEASKEDADLGQVAHLVPPFSCLPPAWRRGHRVGQVDVPIKPP